MNRSDRAEAHAQEQARAHTQGNHRGVRRILGAGLAVVLALALPAASAAAADAAATGNAGDASAAGDAGSRVGATAYVDADAYPAASPLDLGGTTVAGTYVGGAYVGGMTLPQYLDSMWEMVSWIHEDAARPEVAVVRVIAPSEAATVTVECLHSEGFPAATLTASAAAQGVEPGPEADRDLLRYHLALYTCAARYPISA